jgi:predicted ABC-type ATPase
MNLDKKIVIIAGPNGAGKTTFAREFLPNEAHCPVFINADLIAAGFSPFAPEMTATKTIKPLSEARDADARNIVAALRRAASNARQLATQTHTKLIIVNKSNAALGNVKSVKN